MIENYPINKLIHHPLNPRKDYGDITELTASIKAVGILQPLTIVPCENNEDAYYVIIGNRRLDAATMAGLTEIPCELKTDMDHEAIMGAMLTENIVRENLTAYDEAEGFQIMLDLGKSVADVSKSYGFSESTVRKRVNLLSLDKDEFKKATERGATLFDMAKAEEIDDPEERKKVLKAAGTKNFENVLKSAIDKQKTAEYIESVIEAIRDYAESMNHTGYREGKQYLYPEPMDKEGKEQSEGVCVKSITRFSSFSKEEKEINFVPEEGKKYYYISDHYGVSMYEERDPNYVPPKSAEEIMKEERKKEAEEWTAKRGNIELICMQTRIDFIKSFKPKKADLPELWKYLSRAITSDTRIHDSEVKEFGFEKIDKNSYMTEVNPINDENQLKHLLCLAFCKNGGTNNISCSVWAPEVGEYVNKYDLSDKVRNTYDFMIKCGYECSDEEMKLLDGSHEIYDLHWAEKYIEKKEENTNAEETAANN